VARHPNWTFASTCDDDVIIPTRAAKPRDKAKVEAGVLLAERWILARLRNRRLYTLAAGHRDVGGV
jgi:transposase